jgi:SRSO17 transposase
MLFCDSYSDLFTSRGMSSVGHARTYLSGLLGTARRKNIESISEAVQGCDYQGVEQFISSSPWSHCELSSRVSSELDGLLGGHPDSALYIDESGFAKKGRSSVGVARQYCGRLGKVDNCQIGVFAALGCGRRVGICDFRLYLPRSWCEDSRRLDKAGVPGDCRQYASKQELALEMIRSARAAGLGYGWVGFDALYGSDQGLCNLLEDMGERYVGDVISTVKVWTERPNWSFPEASMGRPRKRPVLEDGYGGKWITVGELVGERFESEAVSVTYRSGAKGELKARAWTMKVWTWKKDARQPRERTLIVSEDADGEIKTSLSNCVDTRDPRRLVYMQRQRFWIEHAFGQAKSQLGMAQYQVRKWLGWHHHIALACLASLFALKEQMLQQAEIPLLSVRDITELLEYYLPRKGRSESEVIQAMLDRHRRRQKDIDRRQAQMPLPDI